MATVTIKQGKLRGGKSVTESGFEYYEFLGIPYAKPPVGELRFQNPQLPDSWEGVRDASSCDETKISCQMDFMTKQVVGGDDCLYLNVYTSQLSSTEKSPLPVVVFIHGGGFVYGSGTVKSATGPDYLVEKNTVVVAMNYRLGVLGFLSLDIPEVAGNMGLKDQVKALEWVKQNISEFGGDNYNVTIMGMSAGSASVEYLLLSSSAKGLFHKAILQSGSTLNTWAINLKPINFTRLYLELLDYKGSLEDPKAIYEFLLKISAEELIKVSYLAAEKYAPNRFFFGFVPTVEKEFGNNEAFLTENPYKLFKESNFNKVPVIRGFCNKEGGIISLIKASAVTDMVQKRDFVNLWPYEVDPKEKDSLNSRFTSAYLGKTSDEDLTEPLEDFFGDLDFSSGIWIASKLSSKTVPVFAYVFTYDGNLNIMKKQIGLPKKGAIHGDDFSYVIKTSSLILNNASNDDLAVRNKLVTMFTDFAKTGEPVPVASTDVKKIVNMFSKFVETGAKVSEDDVVSNSWEPMTERSLVYLNIDKELTTLQNYEPEKIAIFEELYEKFFA